MRLTMTQALQHQSTSRPLAMSMKNIYTFDVFKREHPYFNDSLNMAVSPKVVYSKKSQFGINTRD